MKVEGIAHRLENCLKWSVLHIRVLKLQRVKRGDAACKLSSSDFQKGGFNAQDAVSVVRMLNDCLSIWSIFRAAATKAGRCMAACSRPARDKVPWREKPISSILPATSWPRCACRHGQRQHSPPRYHRGCACTREGQGRRGDGQPCAGAGRPAAPLAGGQGGGRVPMVHWKSRALSGLATMALTKLQLRRPKPNAWTPRGAGPRPPAYGRRSRRYRAWLQRRATA